MNEIGAAKTAKPEDIRQRTFRFGIRIVRCCEHLGRRAGSSRELSRQLFRSGTSIGANLEEAEAAHSKADFISKNVIALKEARETRYWLRLAVGSQILKASQASKLIDEADQITRVVASIVLTARRRTSVPVLKY